jgi:hypothetical protein
MSGIRALSCLVLLLGTSVPAVQDRQPQTTPAALAMPQFAQRGLPGPAHKALQPLIGSWQVEKTLYIAGATPQKPITTKEMTCHREWVADGRFVRDETEGQINGNPYWRLGLLGYSVMDERYEWITIDRTNSMMMIYQGKPRSGYEQPITLTGVFTDQGLISESTTGKRIGQRTVIRIENIDRHVLELYFKVPGQPEFLADRSIYTRKAAE